MKFLTYLLATVLLASSAKAEDPAQTSTDQATQALIEAIEADLLAQTEACTWAAIEWRKVEAERETLYNKSLTPLPELPPEASPSVRAAYQKLDAQRLADLEQVGRLRGKLEDIEKKALTAGKAYHASHGLLEQMQSDVGTLRRHRPGDALKPEATERTRATPLPNAFAFCPQSSRVATNRDVR